MAPSKATRSVTQRNDVSATDAYPSLTLLLVLSWSKVLQKKRSFVYAPRLGTFLRVKV